jgi:hypothetical protein
MEQNQSKERTVPFYACKHGVPGGCSKDKEPPTVYEVIAAKAQALADAAKSYDAKLVTLGLRDLDALMPYFQQEPLHHYWDDGIANILRRD